MIQRRDNSIFHGIDQLKKSDRNNSMFQKETLSFLKDEKMARFKREEGILRKRQEEK